MTSIDPNTGQTIQQLVQTVTDPITGETSQVTVPLPNGANGDTFFYSVSFSLFFQIQKSHTGGGGQQIITVPDPITGHPVQQIIQTLIDPVTGQSKQIMVPISSSGSKYYKKTH